MKGSTIKTIRKRISAKRRGWIFTSQEFGNVGSRAAVNQALTRLQRSGKIRRLSRGLYEFPRLHSRIGILSPSPEAIAQALSATTRSRLLVSEAKAANALGLSTQVPAQNVYLTDGPSRTVQVGKQTVTLKHAAASKMIGAGSAAGIVIQAVRYFGPERAGEIPVESLSKKLSESVKSELRRLIPAAPGWSQSILTRIST